MTMIVTHPFVSTKDDGADPTKVRKTDWNANHSLTGGLSQAQTDAALSAIITQAQVLAAIQFGGL